MKTRLAMAAAAMLVLATLALAGCGPKTPALNEQEQAWVERMLDHLQMTGEESKRGYPLNARQALAFAAKQYAGGEGDTAGYLQEGTQVSMVCDGWGKWLLTWTGRSIDEHSGRVMGWSGGSIIDAGTGEVTGQVNADYIIYEPKPTIRLLTGQESAWVDAMLKRVGMGGEDKVFDSVLTTREALMLLAKELASGADSGLPAGEEGSYQLSYDAGWWRFTWKKPATDGQEREGWDGGMEVSDHTGVIRVIPPTEG